MLNRTNTIDRTNRTIGMWIHALVEFLHQEPTPAQAANHVAQLISEPGGECSLPDPAAQRMLNRAAHDILTSTGYRSRVRRVFRRDCGRYKIAARGYCEDMLENFLVARPSWPGCAER